MLERGKHISTSFDSALDSLKNDALMMSSLERSFQYREREVCAALL